MRTALVYGPELDLYRLPAGHPLRPERVSLAVGLMRACGLLRPGRLEVTPPREATRTELLLFHDPRYVDAVVEAGRSPESWCADYGIGPGDTPPFSGMHEASALVAGATLVATDCITSGRYTRSFSIAGGLHHAHADSAAGFCVYNDVAVALRAALARDASLRVFYVDIDAHHGDGVQEAFYRDHRVFTLSVHESGHYLFPGTGFADERGEGPGLGYALNVPMPPMATDECYALVFDKVIAPTVRAYSPDVIVAQCGADGHHSDPLTSLGLTIGGLRDLYVRIVALADEVCGGRLIACGGGGYSWATIVPRCWTLLAAALTGITLPEELPEDWREHVRSFGVEPPSTLTEDPGPRLDSDTRARLLEMTQRVIDSAITQPPSPGATGAR